MGELHCEPWRTFTSALVHTGPFHLVFNLYWLFRLGTALEQRVGSLALLVGVLTSEATAAWAEYALFRSGVGLSGVGYALFGCCWMLARYSPKDRDLVDDRTIALFLIWGLGCIVATALHVAAVANVAHASGLLFGMCAGLAMTRSRLWWLATLACVALSFVGATIARRFVNLSRHDAAQELMASAWTIRERGELGCAVAIARDAVVLDRSGVTLTQLGAAQQAKGDLVEARATFEAGCQLDDGTSCGRLGVMTELGEGGARDLSAALVEYRRACELHVPEGCQNVARFNPPATP